MSKQGPHELFVTITEYDEKHLKIPECECMAATPKAIKVRSPHLPNMEEWFPETQVHDDSEVFEKGDTGDLIITKWIANQKGIE